MVVDMTLIFAGHNLSFENGETKSIGLFVTADSAITEVNSLLDKCTPILSGFQKVYPLHINVYKPSFHQDYDGGVFAGYSSIHFQQTGFLAIAGGTLVLQHVMNLINHNMQNLRITKDNIGYKIIREGETNTSNSSQYYLDSEFIDNHYIGLNTAETYFKHIEYSITSSLNSAKPRTILNRRDTNRLVFEIVVGMYCEVNHNYILKTYTCKPNQISDDHWDFNLTTKDIAKNEIAVLGLKEYNTSAINLLNDLMIKHECISDSYFRLLNSCIDENNSPDNQKNRFAISKPSFLYELTPTALSKIKIHDGITEQILKYRVNATKFKYNPDILIGY